MEAPWSKYRVRSAGGLHLNLRPGHDEDATGRHLVRPPLALGQAGIHHAFPRRVWRIVDLSRNPSLAISRSVVFSSSTEVTISPVRFSPASNGQPFTPKASDRRRVALADVGLGDEAEVGVAEVVLSLPPCLVDDFRQDTQEAAAGHLPGFVVVDDVHVHGGVVLEVEPLPDVDSDDPDVAEVALEGRFGDLAYLLLVHLETSYGWRRLNST